MFCIGIDPGTNTGYAQWNVAERRLDDVRCLGIIAAQAKLLEFWNFVAPNLIVIFEDARTTRMKGGYNYQKPEVLQGVGSVKRDCAIWEEWLQHHRIPYIAKPWCAGTTKWDAERFARTTGWKTRTNGHARDAGVQVYGLTKPMVQGMMQMHAQRATWATSGS